MNVDVVVNVDEIKVFSSTTTSTFTSTIDAPPSTEGLRYICAQICGIWNSVRDEFARAVNLTLPQRWGRSDIPLARWMM